MQSILARILVFITSVLQAWKQRFLLAKGARKAAWGCLPILGACMLCSVVGQAVGVIEPPTPTPTVIARVTEPSPTALLTATPRAATPTTAPVTPTATSQPTPIQQPTATRQPRATRQPTATPQPTTPAALQQSACEQAFAAAAQISDMEDQVDDLDPALQACGSIDEWMQGYARYSDELGFGDPEESLINRCTYAATTETTLCDEVRATYPQRFP